MLGVIAGMLCTLGVKALLNAPEKQPPFSDIADQFEYEVKQERLRQEELAKPVELHESELKWDA